MTGGMDNPVAVAFLPNGERIFTTTFFQDPAFGLRDGLIHAVHGAVYGKVHDVIMNFPWTGPNVMPVLTHMGAAAPCGLVRYESTAFGPEYANNLFACQFNMHKVSRHVLTPHGATYASATKIFWSPTISTFIQPTWSKTPTAACWSSTRAAGTRFVAPRRNCKSPTCSERSIASAASGAADRRPTRVENQLALAR